MIEEKVEELLKCETRPCVECKCFKEIDSGYSICQEKHMRLTPEMRVSFKSDDGNR